jgi:fucose 4-O-acetylase-like acetyltransferase
MLTVTLHILFRTAGGPILLKSQDLSEGHVVKATRQTWIDQARWGAIVLVVIGHAVGMHRDSSDLAVVVSNFVYMFHIPVLVLLAGWGARRAEPNGKTLFKVFWQLLVPYVVFQLIAFLFNHLFEGKSPSWSFTSQTFGLWFLVALAGWRLLAPWFRGLTYAVPLAVGIALMAGLSPNIGGLLSLSRILVFLPMFLAGPWLVDKISHWRHDRRIRFLGLCAVVTGGLVALAMRRDFWRTPFLGNSGYEALDVGVAEGMLWRLLVLVVGTAMAAGFMLMLPGKPGTPTKTGAWLATAGQHTMYPYLLHLPVLTVVGASALPAIGIPSVQTSLFVMSSVIFCILTVQRPVLVLTRTLVEPRNMLQRPTAATIRQDG